MFHTPMINLYSRDLAKAQAFYVGGIHGDIPHAGGWSSHPCRTQTGWLYDRDRDL
jgi:hypothetical protein